MHWKNRFYYAFTWVIQLMMHHLLALIKRMRNVAFDYVWNNKRTWPHWICLECVLNSIWDTCNSIEYRQQSVGWMLEIADETFSIFISTDISINFGKMFKLCSSFSFHFEMYSSIRWYSSMKWFNRTTKYAFECWFNIRNISWAHSKDTTTKANKHSKQNPCSFTSIWTLSVALPIFMLISNSIQYKMDQLM